MARRRWARRRWARVAVSIGLVAYLVMSVPANELLLTLRDARPAGIAVGFTLALAGHLLIAERIRSLAAAIGLRLPYWTLFNINLGAVFYGLALPAGNLGGVAARLYQMARAGGNYAEPAVALTLERLMATITLSAVGAACWLVERPAHALAALVLLLASTLVFGLLPFAILTGRAWAAPVWRWLLARCPRRLTTLGAALDRAQRLPLQTWLAVFGLGVVVHALGIGAYGAVAWSLDLDLSLWTIGWTRSAAILIAIVPISVAGLGVREGALVVLLAPYGVDQTAGVAYGLLAFAATILAVGLLGGVLEGRRWLATSTSAP